MATSQQMKRFSFLTILKSIILITCIISIVSFFNDSTNTVASYALNTEHISLWAAEAKARKQRPKSKPAKKAPAGKGIKERKGMRESVDSGFSENLIETEPPKPKPAKNTKAPKSGKPEPVKKETKTKPSRGMGRLAAPVAAAAAAAEVAAPPANNSEFAQPMNFDDFDDDLVIPTIVDENDEELLYSRNLDDEEVGEGADDDGVTEEMMQQLLAASKG